MKKNIDTLDFILDKYNIGDQKFPVNLPYKRWDRIPKLIRELGFAAGAEIGVKKGRFARNICRYNPQLSLYGVDVWEIYQDYDGLPLVNQEIMLSYYGKAQEILKPYKVKLIKAFSMDAVREFADESLDFVYIDANHKYEYCVEDIREWSRKVRKGGLVAGHDYYNGLRADFGGMQTNYGIKRAVDEWVEKNSIKYLFILAGDEMPTWMYVK